MTVVKAINVVNCFLQNTHIHFCQANSDYAIEHTKIKHYTRKTLDKQFTSIDIIFQCV